MTDPYSSAGASADWDPSEGILLPSEVAEALRVDVNTVQRWARHNRCPWLRLPGGDWRFSARWLRTYLEDGRGQ
jgi:excisionase family DNA binding protein